VEKCNGMLAAVRGKQGDGRAGVESEVAGEWGRDVGAGEFSAESNKNGKEFLKRISKNGSRRGRAEND
jgi:hypothetical protein